MMIRVFVIIKGLVGLIGTKLVIVGLDGGVLTG